MPTLDPALPPLTIEVEHLVKTYAGIAAVNDVSFTVRRGEIVGLLGPNGAGKSTTMRILTGFLPATSGIVRICGIPVASRTDEAKRHIGYMAENNPLPEDMRINEYLYYRGRLKEIAREKLRLRLDEVLELCDLKRIRHRIIGKLSKGMRQRVGIAESILAEPEVIIMDEPTIGLDPHQILIVRDLDRRPARPHERHHFQPHSARDRDDVRPRADHQRRPDRGAGHAGRAAARGARASPITSSSSPATSRRCPPCSPRSSRR